MSNVIIPSSLEDRRKIRGALVEISDSLTRISAERDLIKDIVAMLSDNYGLPKKQVNKMARVYHKQSFDTEVAEQDDFQTLYETITGSQSAV